jgi:hypothetical protein
MAPRGKSGKTNSYTISIVGVKSLAFSNDYDGLLRNDSDWAPSGTPIQEPKWDQMHSEPIVFPIKTIPELEVTFHVEMVPSIKGEFFGNGDALFLTYQGEGDFYKGDVTCKTRAEGAIWDVVKKYSEDIKIEWKITTKQGTINEGVTRHIIYGIYGNPINEGLPEDGATTKRMDTAVEWHTATGEREPVKIVKALFARMPFYRLSFDDLPKTDQDYLNGHPQEKQSLESAGFPGYLNIAIGGAWPLVQYYQYCAECQAIVRLIIGILHQIGFPGTLERKYVNADAPDIRKQIIGDYGTSPRGPDPTKKYALVDGEVIVGRVYQAADGVGFNRFEAYLKFSYTTSSGVNRVAWFGGGTGIKGDADASDSTAVQELEKSLILVFWGMAEIELIDPTPRNWKFKVTKIWQY